MTRTQRRRLADQSLPRSTRYALAAMIDEDLEVAERLAGRTLAQQIAERTTTPTDDLPHALWLHR